MYRKFLCFAPVIVALLLTGCKGKTSDVEAQKEYSVLTVRQTNVEETDKYPATIKGRQDIEIYPQITGKITRVCVHEGQQVKRGQTLFIIDQVSYRAALLTAEANLNAARAGVATAQLNYNGKKELYENKVTSAFELQRSRNSLLSSRASQQQAQAQVVSARNDLSYTVVKSPCDGVVGTIPYRAGTLVSPTTASPLTTVSDNSKMYVYFSIPENDMISLIRRFGSSDKALAAMPEVCLYLNDGSKYEHNGRIESMSGVIDSETGSVSLRAVFSNPNGLLHSGGAGNIGLQNRKSNVLTIPQSATYELQDKVYCFRYVNGKAVSTRIKAQAISEQKIYVVTDGLKAGDVIIAEGAGLLQDGQEIKVKR